MRLIGRAACGALVVAAALSACVAPPPQPRDASPGHLSDKPTVVPADIPEPVGQAPFVPLPRPEPPVETYTVVVNEVPVKELLFALSRDAKINVDVHPNISGNVTLNAVDQTLFQILERISRQIDVRYEDRDGTIVVMPDAPFLRTYKVDYVNVTRESTGKIGASTLVAGGGEGGAGGANTSEATINNTINNRFWETLQASIEAIVRPDSGPAPEGGDAGVTMNREGGLLLVRATAKQHEMVSDYLDMVMASATRQVLIEATIVEVQLSDRYQAGIDWTALTRSMLGLDLTVGSDLGQAFIAGASGGVTGLILNYADKPSGSELDLTINLLNEFGDTQVLSSPKVMTLNNQPAVLKVVDNEVYFEINIDTSQTQTNVVTTVDTDARTVSVGLVMSVTPQISESEAVTLNVRPTITRVREFVDDPGVPIALAQLAAQLPAGSTVPDVSNRVPVVQVRETETVMRIGTGQLAVLGGLMQDRRFKDDESVPGFSEVPLVGELFKFREREQTKTELVVFLRPTVIKSPDIGGEFSSFERYLPKNLQDHEALPSLLKPSPSN